MHRAQLVQRLERLVGIKFREPNPVVTKLPFEGIEEHILSMHPGVGFDQRGAVASVQLPLPLHARQVLVAIDVRCNVARTGDAEVLDVDAVIGQVEVRLVLAPARAGRSILVGPFVLVADALQGEPVSDDALLVGPHPSAA